MSATFIDAAQVAELIGLDDRAQFLRRREDMENHNDFPQPLPHILRPMKWRRELVEAWLNEAGQPINASQHQIPQGQNVHLLRKAATA